MADIAKFIEDIKALSVLELNELVKAIENEFGVVLKEIGASKLNVIKVVRELTGLGLVEAKNMVESAPSTIKEAQPKELAEQMVAKLKEAGAVAELK